MPTPTYTPLANITLGSSAASVTFSSISQAYRDLVLVINGTANTNNTLEIRFNGDTAGNYNWVWMSGDGSVTQSSASSNTSSGISLGDETYFGTTRTNRIINIMDYSATDKHKTLLDRGNRADTGTDAEAGRWASTAAITTIRLWFPGGASFTSGSSFALYGVAA